jgi:hypothetical protein
VVADRVARAQGQPGLADGRGTVQLAGADLGDVVDDVRSQQLLVPVQLTRVGEVAVQVDQVRDVDAVLRGQRHDDPLK